MKGRKIFHREAKKRGGRNYLRGISNLKIAIVVAQDRNGNVVVRKAGNGRVKAEEIDVVLGDYIHPSALLCTDTATNYKKFRINQWFVHETINEWQKERVKKAPHIKVTFHLLTTVSLVSVSFSLKLLFSSMPRLFNKVVNVPVLK